MSDPPEPDQDGKEGCISSGPPLLDRAEGEGSSLSSACLTWRELRVDPVRQGMMVSFCTRLASSSSPGPRFQGRAPWRRFLIHGCADLILGQSLG